MSELLTRFRVFLQSVHQSSGLCAGINSYVASRILRMIDYGLRRHNVHHNSNNTTSVTKVAWCGYWPLLLFIS